jgi:hypothetical protein
VNPITLDSEGICTACREWTTIGDSCCGAGVWVEGSVYTADDLEDEE